MADIENNPGVERILNSPHIQQRTPECDDTAAVHAVASAGQRFGKCVDELSYNSSLQNMYRL